MRKYIALQYDENPLQIKSVSAPEGLKGTLLFLLLGLYHYY